MRVAYFPDTFHEINGVAHTSRQFWAFARRHDLPFLCVRAGDRAEPYQAEGQSASLELKRGPFSFGLEKDLRFDIGFARHLPYLRRKLEKFRPEIVHITGPSEVGMIGAYLAKHLHLPLVASWHTNLHDYAVKRSSWFLRALPQGLSNAAGGQIRNVALTATAHFYQLADLLYAPNPELCQLLEEKTGRRCLLMPRGVDTQLFTPARRERDAGDRDFVLGFVGRLSVEKNVSLLPTIARQLAAMGIANFRFLVVGHGAETEWLREQLPTNSEFPGVLRGEELAQAYANMDLFVFPSHTETFGNVVLEALASGVPAVITPDGGPRYIVREGETGTIAEDVDFASATASILLDSERHARMRLAARNYALGASWDAVFEGVYGGYESVVPVKRASALLNPAL